MEFVRKPRLTYSASYFIVTKMSDQKVNPKFALLAGILVAGLFAAVFAGTQLVQSAAAQNNGTESDLENGTESTVTTSGTATTSVDPDKFTVTVGAETNGTTAEEATSSNADLVAAIIAALKELDISEDQITTTHYSVQPIYSHTDPVNACMVLPGNPVPPECYVSDEVVSYRASSSVSVTLDADGDISAGEVIDTTVEAGANTVSSGAYYFLSSERQEQVRDELIAEAIANARHRADIAAEAVGMEVSGVKSINLNDVHFPVFSKGLGATEAADTQILPGQQEVSMNVSVTYLVQ